MSTLLLLVVPLGRVPLLVLLDEEELPERGGTKGMGVGPAPLLLLAGLAGPVTRPGMGGRTTAGVVPAGAWSNTSSCVCRHLEAVLHASRAAERSWMAVHACQEQQHQRRRRQHQLQHQR